MTWEKLAIELELLQAEDPNSLLPLVLGLNSFVWPHQNSDSLVRTIQFMTYELIAQCEKKNEAERVRTLVDYFFLEKGFQPLQPPSKVSLRSEQLGVESLIEHRLGYAPPALILFLHFANSLDLPLYSVHLENHVLVKWVRPKDSLFIDLLQRGQILDEKALIPVVGLEKTHSDCGNKALEILSNRMVFSKYLNTLSAALNAEGDREALLTCLNVQIKSDPTQMRAIGARAVLLQKLGRVDEALADFKRYFSFVDRDSAPAEILQSYVNLEKMLTHFRVQSPEGLLH